MKRIIIIAVATALAIVGFTYMSRSQATESPEAEEQVDFSNIPLTSRQVKTAGIVLGQAENRTIADMLSANGQIVLRAKDKASVASLMGGVVKSILVAEGQQVGKGQTVAMVENTDVVSLQRELYSAAKECEFAHLDFLRQQKLSQTGAGISRNLEQARKEYSVLKAQVQGLEQQLRQMGINPSGALAGKFQTSFPVHSPISGTVTAITASLGSYGDMQTPLMSIRDNSAVECDLSVYEKDLAKVRVGDAVLLSVVNQPGKKVAGRVYGINRHFNDGSKAVAVHVRLLSGHDSLFEGEYVSGKIAVGSRQGKTLPSSAIIRSDGKSYIFALNGQPNRGSYHFSRHEVTVGESDKGYTAVKLCKHIKQGQEIVTGNAFYLASLTGDHGEE